MRAEIAGSQITDSVIDVIETLQTDRDLTGMYVRTLDEMCREVLFDLTAIDDEEDSKVLGIIRTLQMIRRDILTLALPPDRDDPMNDEPILSI